MRFDTRHEIPAGLYRTMVDRSPHAVFVLDRRAHCRFVNQAGCRLVGWQADDLLGGGLLEALPADLRERGRERLDEFLRQGSLAVVLPATADDGARRWWSVEAVTVDPDVFILYVADVTEHEDLLENRRGVTELEQAEAGRFESEARLRVIFDTAQDGLFLKDRRLRYTHVNPAFQHFFQRPVAQIVGRVAAELYPPAEAAMIEAIDREVLAGEAHRGIYEHRLDDRILYLETIKVPVRGEGGGIVGICGVSRDITEFRRLEERLRQAQKMEAVGRLAGGIAHDFNNMLTPILGFAGLLMQSRGPDDPERKDLEAIVRAAERARDLTAQLLVFGRQQILKMELIDLNQVVRDSEPMLRRVLRENIDLKLDLAPTVGAVRADRSQLSIVLFNLAANRAAAMPAGGELVIETRDVMLDEDPTRAHSGISPGMHTLLAVSDDGPDIDPAMLARIFEPFASTRDLHEGTGLDLATVHGIVKQHGGQIQVRSADGAGTRFEIHLQQAGDEARTDLEQPGPGLLRGRERILLVEDDDAVREMANLALSRLGYAVQAADSPAAALALECGGPDGAWDLLLTDVVMPGMNGVQLHLALLEICPGLPVLYMSGYAGDVIARQGIERDGPHFLQKPFTPYDLATKVRQVLDAGGGS